MLSASLGLEDQMNINDEAGNSSNGDLTENVYGLGIAYGGDFGSMTLDLGAGIQYTELLNEEAMVYGGSAVLGFGNFEVIGVVEVFDTDSVSASATDGESYGISGAYTTGPWGIRSRLRALRVRHRRGRRSGLRDLRPGRWRRDRFGRFVG